jgi:hypothetical protein
MQNNQQAAEDKNINEQQKNERAKTDGNSANTQVQKEDVNANEENGGRYNTNEQGGASPGQQAS